MLYCTEQKWPVWMFYVEFAKKKKKMDGYRLFEINVQA